MVIKTNTYMSVVGADIELRDITVFAGKNNKSLSDMLYCLRSAIQDTGACDKIIDMSFVRYLGECTFIDLTGFDSVHNLVVLEEEHEMDSREKKAFAYIYRKIKQLFGEDADTILSADTYDPAEGAFLTLLYCVEHGVLTDRTFVFGDNICGVMPPAVAVELADVMVELNRALGCKFVFSTHVPDFVTAVAEISEAMGAEAAFYLSVKNGETGLFEPVHLGTDVSRIFADFNKSYELIKLYSMRIDEN